MEWQSFAIVCFRKVDDALHWGTQSEDRQCTKRLAVSLPVDSDIDSDWPTFTGDWQGHHWPFVLGAFEQTITADSPFDLKAKSCVLSCLIYQMECLKKTDPETSDSVAFLDCHNMTINQAKSLDDEQLATFAHPLLHHVWVVRDGVRESPAIGSSVSSVQVV